MKYVIGIDNGSQSTKVSIFDMNGNEICYGQKFLRDTQSLVRGQVVHPDDDLWDSVYEGIKACLEKFKGNKKDIVAIGLCSIRCCRALLKDNCELHEPIISWMDERMSKPYVHQDDQVKYVTTTSGYLTYKLTGLKKDTAANYEVYWPINPHTLEWSSNPTDYEEMGVKPEMLFELVKPGQCLGKLTSKLANYYGLNEDVQVFATANDKAVEALGAGIDNNDTIMISLGTFISAMLMRDQYFENAKNFFPTLAAIPHKYVYESNGIRRGMWTVTWFKQLIGEELTNWSTNLGISEEEYLNQLASKVNPGSDGLITILDWLASPSEPYRKGIMIGFDVRHTKYHIYRSILEAIAYNIKNNIDMMLDEIKTDISKIVVIGGGSNSDVLMQIIADLFGKTTVRRKVKSAAALGAAISCYVGLEYDLTFESALARINRVEEKFTPNMELNKFYNQINEDVVKNVRKHTDEILKIAYPIFNK